MKHLTGRHDQGNHGHGNGLGVPLTPDAVPGDKLKLIAGLRLEPGERLIGSAKVKVENDNNESEMFMAATDGAGGRQLRIGIPPPDYSDPEYDDDGEQIEKVAWTGNDPGDTVRLDAAGLDQMRADFDRHTATAKAWQAEANRNFAAIERLEAQYHRAYDESRDRRDPETLVLAADDRAKIDAIRAELEPLYDWQEAFEPDAMIAEGVIPGAPGHGELAYEIEGDDLGKFGWAFRFAIKPSDAPADWSVRDSDAIVMSSADQARFQRQIASMLGDQPKADTTSATTRSRAMQTKSFQPTFKALDEQGTVSFVVATLNDIDKDGDVTLPGFFGKQHAVVVPVHNWDHVPIGKAHIYEQGNEVVVDAKLNLAIPAAKDWHEAIKFDMANPPALQEYSYGYTVLDGGSESGDFKGQRVRYLKAKPDGTAGVDVHEVSPVLLGAGNGTRTLGVKSAPLRFADQAQAVVAAVRALSDRAADVMAMRLTKGKGLSADSAALLAEVERELKRFGDLLATAPDEPDTGELQRIFLQQIARTHR